MTENVPDSPEKKPLLGLCRTCWAERHSAYQHFYQAYTVKPQKRSLDIMDVHELMQRSLLHKKVRGRMWTSVSSTSTSKVSKLLKVSALLQKCPESQVVNSTAAILHHFQWRTISRRLLPSLCSTTSLHQ